MLHSYQAELNGSQLIWIDSPPAPLVHKRVVVVVEAQNQETVAQPAGDRIQGFLSARGCMGQASREQVLASLDALREDWSRDPLGSANKH